VKPSHHLDDEQLSAHLDGEGRDAAGADDEAVAHLRSCPSCQARSSALRRVAAVVGEAVPSPPSGAEDEAVQAALAAWDEEHARRHHGSLAQLAPRRARALPRWAVVAAAVVVVVLLAVPVIAALTGEVNRPSPTALGGSDGRAELAQGFVEGGDLGDHSDGEALGAAVRQRLGAPQRPADAAAPEGTPGIASQGGEPGEPPTAAAPPPSARRSPPCESAVRSTYGQGLGPLVFTASLRWRGTPAVLLVYRLTDPRSQALARRAFVMSADTCELLVVQFL
jgi:hypothetical protein